MNNLAGDCIVIDTNIFIDLFNPQKNTNNHIEALLNTLQEDCIRLIVDKGGKILGEYKNSIGDVITNKTASSEYRELLKYWLTQEYWEEDTRNDLITAIKQIIGKNNTVDATFVCVAMISKKALITNDREDIIDRGNRIDYTRNKLLNLAKKSPYRHRSFRIWDSKEAHDKL